MTKKSLFELKKGISPVVLSSAMFLSAVAAGAVDEPVKSSTIIDPPPVVRTEEDVKKGKENVKNVVEELSAMLTNPSSSIALKKMRQKAQPPYCKIIKSGKDRATLVFRPRYTTVKQVFNALDSVVAGATYLECVAEQNILVLSTTAEDVEGYRQLLLAMDIPTPQVLIEAKVVEVTFTDGVQRNFAFNWSNEHGGIGASGNVPGQSSQPNTGFGTAWNFNSGDNNFSLAFQWLRTADDAKVLSSPNILITGNETSRIETGSDVPIQEFNATSSTTSFTTKFKRVGVSLEVEPKFISDDSITLRVLPSVSNISSYETVESANTAYSVPIISIRTIESYLRMRNEQVVMLGGLYSSNYAMMQERTPFISDIPFIGELFTGKKLTKEVTQLIFFMKVHIIPADEEYSTIFYNPDENAATSENLGRLLKSMNSFPMHRSTAEDLEEEVRDALPGMEEKNRKDFRLDIDAQIDSWFNSSKSGVKTESGTKEKSVPEDNSGAIPVKTVAAATEPAAAAAESAAPPAASGTDKTAPETAPAAASPQAGAVDSSTGAAVETNNQNASEAAQTELKK